MNHPNLPQHRTKRPNGYFLGFLAIAGYFLLTEHRAHVLPYLPFLLLLACPLMHLFMHRGHGHDGHEHGCGHQHGARNRQEEHDDRSDHQTQ